MDKAEYEAIQDSASVSLARPTDIPSHIVDNLGPRVHVSIDVDCFDPSVISQTGTPVPGGLTYREVTQQLREIFDTHDVVSADIVEFAPDEDEPSRRRAEAYSLAKLLYHVLALKDVSRSE
jgi:agmatinase